MVFFNYRRHLMSANEKQVGGDHYKRPGHEEHWDRMWRLFGRGYFVGQITKYAERYMFKEGIKDLEKAKHFVEKLIELEKGKIPPGLQYMELPWPLTPRVPDDAPAKKVAVPARRRHTR